MDFKRLNENLKKAMGINEIAMERYLSVEPCDGGFLPNTNIEYNAEVVLYKGDTVEDSIMFDTNDYKTDEDIRRLAKEHFDNIPDDIRVQWY